MTPSAAAGAYAAMANVARPGADAGQASGDGFAQLLEASVNGFVDAGRAAETTGMDAAVGKADVVDVVTAVAETEIALETMVTLRDRVIQAYEEIMRMPI